MEILALGVLLSAFLLGLVLGAPYIRALRQFRIGQNIRPEGPQTHYVKQGIPTMGGALFIGVTCALWVFVLLLLPQNERDVFIPQTCRPLLHDGEVCLRALNAASCSDYATFVDDDAPALPSECEFCRIPPPGSTAPTPGVFGDAGAPAEGGAP